MHFKTRVWGLGKFLLLVGALAATFFIFAAAAMRVALRSREVRVPALVGRTVNEASNTLASIGLSLRIDPNQRSDDKIAAGRVMLQDPAAGVAARQQRTIRVWVSSGPRSTSVPQLVGQTERTARMRIEQDGLEVGSLTEFRSPDYPADAVVAQDPAPSARAPKVSMLLNRGEESVNYVMPDLIGMNAERAADALRDRGFRVSITGSQPYPGVPQGTVVRQQPAGGFKVAPSDPISLEVSR